MRFRSLFFFFTALAATAAASELTIVRVFTGWRDAASFKRISEYFNGRENTGGETVLRTHADQRAGYYFLVRAANSGAPLTVKISVQMITPTNAKPKTYTFATELKSGQTVLDLGLTGGDWTDARANPVAWKLAVAATDGRELATADSYLWEGPVGK